MKTLAALLAATFAHGPDGGTPDAGALAATTPFAETAIVLDQQALWEIEPMRRGDPFPYDAGIALSEEAALGKAREQVRLTDERLACRDALQQCKAGRSGWPTWAVVAAAVVGAAAGAGAAALISRANDGSPGAR